MPEITKRDRIWNTALKKDGSIDPEELSERLDISERTVRDTLNVMEKCYFLEKRQPGPKKKVSFYSLVDDPLS